MQRESELRMVALNEQYEANRQGEPFDRSANWSIGLGQLRQELGEADYERYLVATGQSISVPVRQVLASSPAEAAGLQRGDQIVGYAGERVFSLADLNRLTLGEAGRARAKTSDANHFLYLAKANQLFYSGHGESLFEGLLAIDSPVLIIHTDEDLIFPGETVRETATIIRSDGTPVQVVEIEGTRGHLDGVLSFSQAGASIAKFLND